MIKDTLFGSIDKFSSLTIYSKMISFLFLILVLASAAPPYPPPFLNGVFIGNVSVSPVGPFSGYGVVFRQQPNKELLFETLDLAFPTLTGSYQNWWLEENMNTYCGLLTYDDGKYYHTIVEHFVYRPDLSDTGSVQWCAYSRGGGCDTFVWTIAVVDGDPNTLDFWVAMSNVTHMKATLYKQPTPPDTVPVNQFFRQYCYYLNGNNVFTGSEYFWLTKPNNTQTTK